VRRSAKVGLKTTVNQASLIVEVLSGIRAVKAFNLEGKMVDRFRRLCGELFGSSMRIVRAKEITNPIVESIGTLGFGILVVIVVVRQVSLENMVSMLAGVAFIYTPVKRLAGIHNLLEQTDAGVERLIQTMAEWESSQATVDRIVHAVNQFTDGAPPTDDRTLVVAKVR